MIREEIPKEIELDDENSNIDPFRMLTSWLHLRGGNLASYRASLDTCCIYLCFTNQYILYWYKSRGPGLHRQNHS